MSFRRGIAARLAKHPRKVNLLSHGLAPPTPEIRAAIDAEHLRLLKIGYYIAGSVTAVFSCFLIIHFTVFLVFGLNPQMVNVPSKNGQHVDPPPAGMFLGFAAVIGALMVLGWIFGALQIYAGRCIGQRRNLTLIFIVAAFECIFLPWGTAIGVFSFIILNRPAVKALFS